MSQYPGKILQQLIFLEIPIKIVRYYRAVQISKSQTQLCIIFRKKNKTIIKCKNHNQILFSLQKFESLILANLDHIHEDMSKNTRKNEQNILRNWLL